MNDADQLRRSTAGYGQRCSEGGKVEKNAERGFKLLATRFTLLAASNLLVAVLE